ncbi:hypothetical protein [Halovivax limisalsi]|uniref:hypothetical protein n=1 Tax=Halovivax limisalsi TaxID=1453760 RepID=UPI001FFDB9DE|nr:hypothetical protein [Halovivax limisalsi]
MPFGIMAPSHHENGERVSERWNAVFEALSSEPRRQLIVSLLDAEANEPVPLPESAVMSNVPPDPETLRLELHHVHLPMLAELGFITWETDPLVAARGPQFDEVAVVFEAFHEVASSIPESLVVGCRRLEEEMETSADLC